MSIPTGYEKLAVIGIAWKNEYVQGTAYKTMNAVYYNGSTYVALRDNPTGPPAADGANWQYLAKGFEQQLLSAITALDTSGVLGQAGATVGGQALMDAIADKVMTKLIAKSQIVNNLLATEPGNVLDATQGKALKDDITELYSDLDDRDPAADLFVIADVGSTARRIVKCNKDTLNTPYKAGLTAGIDTGTAIISMGSVNYGVIFYLPDGGISTAPFVCKKTNSTWGDWEKLIIGNDMQSGRINGLSCAAGAITEYNLTFPSPFAKAPRVMLTINSGTTYPNYGRLLPMTTNVTTTGCKIRVANSAEAAYEPNIEWVAVGT